MGLRRLSKRLRRLSKRLRRLSQMSNLFTRLFLIKSRKLFLRLPRLKKTKQKRRKSESAFRSKKNKLPNYKSFAINTYLKIERVNISNYSQQNGHSQLSLSNDLHIVLNVKFCHFFERKLKIISLGKKKKKKKKS